MTKVKIFHEMWKEDLEKNINLFLHNPYIELIDIKYYANNSHFALVIYEEKGGTF